jgi:hypothetical protein
VITLGNEFRKLKMAENACCWLKQVFGTENGWLVTKMVVGMVETDSNGRKESDMGASCCRWMKTAGLVRKPMLVVGNEQYSLLWSLLLSSVSSSSVSASVYPVCLCLGCVLAVGVSENAKKASR